jgi:transglutaminase-like putative cysteine protease
MPEIDPNGRSETLVGDRSPSPVLYVAAMLAQLTGLTAVRFQLSDPTFAFVTMFLTIAGFLTSFLLRRRGISATYLKAGVLVLALVFLYAIRGQGTFAAIAPAEATMGSELSIVAALAFTAAIASFLALSDEAVVFSCVWTIAIIGLAGTMDINRELVLCFAAFLMVASFLLVHQNYLAQMRRAGVPPDPLAPSLLRLQVITALTAWFIAIVLGLLVAIPLQVVGRRMSLRTVVEKLRVPASQAAARAASRLGLSFENPLEFRVGLGAIGDDQTVVLRVRSDEPHYWRGRSFQTYNGRGWVNPEFAVTTPLSPESTAPDGVINSFQTAPPNATPRRDTKRITARFEALLATGSLFHAAEPISLRAPLTLITRRFDGTLSARYGPGTIYEVDSEISVAKPADLDRTSTEYPPEIAEPYLQVPPDPAIKELAAAATASVVPTKPFARAEAIRLFITSRCVYTLEARAVPPATDSVTFFLNESQEGYCDLFATSMAILCRSAGLPARVVTGFNAGSEDPEAKGWYILRNANRHAWTEVYFVGYGWIPFDATADTSTTVNPRSVPEPVRKQNWRDLLMQSGPRVLLSVGVVGLGFVGLMELQRRRTVRGPRMVASFSEHQRRVVRQYQEAVGRTRRLGVPRPATMTAQEHVAAVRERLGDAVGDALATLAELSDRALYAGDPLSSDAVNATRTAYRRFEESLRDARLPKS